MRSDFVFPTHPAHDLQVLALAAAVITPQFGHSACSWCSFPALGDLNPTRCWSALEIPGVLTALTLWSYNFFFFFNFRRFLKGFYVVLFWRHKHEDAVSCNYSLTRHPSLCFLAVPVSELRESFLWLRWDGGNRKIYIIMACSNMFIRKFYLDS